MTRRSKMRIRADVEAMTAYTPTASLDVFAKRLGMAAADIIKLDANENPYGPAPAVREALASLDHINIYPDPESGQLRDMLADYTGVSSEQILCGAGADELIEIVLQLFIEPGDVIINTPPTFAMYGFNAPLYYSKVVDVWRRPDFSLDAAAVEKAALEHKAKLVFLCSPNNPSGNLIDPQDIQRLLKLPCAVVVDEAYIEFSSQESLAAQAAAAPNLIVLRTMSKWAGLAGLRVGYGIFPRELMPQLWKIKQPYNLNLAADVAAQASLQNADYLLAKARQLVAQRQRMETALAELPCFSPYPSETNFVLNRVQGRPAADLRDALARAGIIVRHYRKPRLNDHIRISAGAPEQIDRLLDALKHI